MTRPLGDELLGLLADTTSTFISCSVSEIEAAIDRSLAAVGRMFDVDRAYLFTFLDGHAVMTNTHEWCAPDVEPAIDDLQAVPCDALRWWMEELHADRCINLSSLDDLPDHAVGERAVIEPQGIQSLLVVPMFWDHRLEGFVGFDHVRSHRTWSAEEIGVLRIVVNAFAQAFERRRREELEHQLHRMAYHDPLTALPNRILFGERLEHALSEARRGGQNLAVCYVDLDGFKPVNDTHGHEAGDRLLVEVARRLGRHLRVSDTAARLGGDEFAVLLRGLRSAAAGTALVERLLRNLAEPFEVSPGVTVRIGASVGVRFVPPDDADAGTVLRQADKAIYTAKQQGAGRFCLFDPARHHSDAPAAAHPASTAGASTAGASRSTPALVARRTTWASAEPQTARRSLRPHRSR
jgi:diguanylate cyclase (GGDEF)-like protein